ncbi:MAG: ABC transporter transmembrane domain-containing protein, partial [Acidobacteriota bacterium]
MSWIRNNEWLNTKDEKTIRWDHLRRFSRLYSPFKNYLAVAAVFAIFGAIVAYFIPVVFRVVQDAMMGQNVNLVLLALGGFFLIMLAEVGASYGVQRINTRVATKLNEDLVLRYYRKILNLSVEDFIAFRQRTNLFQRIIDAMAITGQFTGTLVRGGQLLITILVIGIVIATVSPQVLGVILLGAAGLFVHALIQARKLAALRAQSLGVNYPLVGKMTEV